MKVIKDKCYKGTRILVGNEKRKLIQSMTSLLISCGFQEISIPVIQFQETFSGKVGEENNNLMFNFTDKKDRDLCLAPEYTATIQDLSKTVYRFEKDVKLFYVQECFRGERPQKGRYRQFTQLGVEILNPTKNYIKEWLWPSDSWFRITLPQLADRLLYGTGIEDRSINLNVSRGLDYYNEGQGFEITAESLGSSKQICGGGSYDGGVGFAIGIDRILEYYA